MKNLTKEIPLLVLLLISVSVSVFGQNAVEVDSDVDISAAFYIPYWDKGYQQNAGLTISEINVFKELEQKAALDNFEIREQQLFWEEENALMAALTNEKRVMMASLLNEEQLQLAKAYCEEKAAELSTPVDTPVDEEAMAAEVELAMERASANWVKINEEANYVINNYYIAERAVLREKLDQIISKEEKLLIERLRKENALYLEKTLAENSVENEDYSEFERGEREFIQVIFGNMMMEASVEKFLMSNPENYYAAKELAVKYDEYIDEIQREMLLLNYSTYEKLNPFAPADIEMPSLDHLMLQHQNTPDYIEIERNVLFLLLNISREEGIVSDRVAHTVTIYPVPANDFQSILFEMKEAGPVTIEIIGSDGSVLNTVFSGNLDKGVHKQEVNIQTISRNLFFYRVTSEEGTSLVKSMKIN